MDCAGVHRSLGTHITYCPIPLDRSTALCCSIQPKPVCCVCASSQVRSTDLDTWQPKWVQFMSTVGNARANSYFEARLTSARRLSNFPSEQYVCRSVDCKC
jgi:hypothetical protein